MLKRTEGKNLVPKGLTHYVVKMKICTFVNKLDLSQMLINSTTGLKSNLFATEYTIPIKNKDNFKVLTKFQQQTTFKIYSDGQKKRYIEILQCFKDVLGNLDVLINSVMITKEYTTLN